MKNKTIIIIVVILGLAGGAVFMLGSDKPRPTTSSQSQNNAPSTVNQSTVGKYVDYSDTVIANTQGQKILFFHAPWCPQCRDLEKSIKAGTIPENVTIIKVDYDTNQSLRRLYGVTIQTTLVKVDDHGNLVKKYVAYNEPTLSVLIEELL